MPLTTNKITGNGNKVRQSGGSLNTTINGDNNEVIQENDCSGTITHTPAPQTSIWTKLQTLSSLIQCVFSFFRLK